MISITLGAGRKNSQGRRAEVEDLIDVLEGHEGEDAWWSCHIWEGDYRNASKWQRSLFVVIDLDYGIYTEKGGKVASVKQEVPEAQRRALLDGWDYGAFCPTAAYAHPTPHGHRVIWRFDAPCKDADLWLKTALGACAIAREDLLTLGLPIVTRDTHDKPGWHVDVGASTDRARLFFAPNSTVNGRQRVARMQERRSVMTTADELARHAPDEEPEAEATEIPPEVKARVSDATERWNADHEIVIPDKGKRIDCFVCGSERCLGAVPGMPGRVACHSETHKHLDPPCGSPSKTKANYVFSALDVEVWRRSKKTGFGIRKSDVLRDDGYLRAKATPAEAVPEEESVTPRRPQTDVGNSERITDKFGADMRFTKAHGWLIWDGTRWRKDETGQATRRSIAAIKAIWREVEAESDPDRAKIIAKWAARSQDRGKIESALSLARVQLGIAELPARFDRDLWAINTPTCTIDLRTGESRDHRRSDLITRRATVGPEAGEPTLWLQFLERVQPDPEIRAFLQRWAGYAMTGVITDQSFVFMYGGGANGKSTFVETLCYVLGDYATLTPFDTFLVRARGAPTNDLADLAGARMVRASEPDEGVRLSESVLKQATGGEPIKCRFLHREFFEFTPQFKICLVGNHKPNITGTDHGIWRRVQLVPWTVQIPESEWDLTLKEKLREEAGRIMGWMLEGVAQWRDRGLDAPKAVRVATAEYRRAEDVVGLFLGECCTLNPSLQVTNSDLAKVYKEWCRTNGENHLSMRALGGQLSDRGFSRFKSMGNRGWRGFALKPEYAEVENDWQSSYE